MGMLLRRYYDETYTNPVEDKGVATSVAPKIEQVETNIAEPEKADAVEVDLESMSLVELRKLGKEHGIPKAHLKGKAELCELLKELV